MIPDQTVSLQTWAVIGQWIVFIGTLTASIMGIAKFISWIRSKSSVAKVTETVKIHETRINTLEERMDKSEEDRKDMHDVNRLTLTAVQALLKNNLEGDNNINGMQKASDAIQEYLNNMIG